MLNQILPSVTAVQPRGFSLADPLNIILLHSVSYFAHACLSLASTVHVDVHVAIFLLQHTDNIRYGSVQKWHLVAYSTEHCAMVKRTGSRSSLPRKLAEGMLRAAGVRMEGRMYLESPSGQLMTVQNTL